ALRKRVVEADPDAGTNPFWAVVKVCNRESDAMTASRPPVPLSSANWTLPALVVLASLIQLSSVLSVVLGMTPLAGVVVDMSPRKPANVRLCSSADWMAGFASNTATYAVVASEVDKDSLLVPSVRLASMGTGLGTAPPGSVIRLEVRDESPFQTATLGEEPLPERVAPANEIHEVLSTPLLFWVTRT